MTKKVLFVRHFTRLFGGHIRHWHYWQHVKKARGFEPVLLFKGSFNRSDNPWYKEKRITELDWSKIDIVLLGGVSWNMVSPIPPHIPIINLIQGTQHTRPPRSKFLSQRAVRICMSTQIKNIVKSRANGPIFTVNPSVGTAIVRGGERDIPVLVIGHKRKPLVRKIGLAIPKAKVLTKFIPRQDLFKLMQRSQIVVGLPKRREGFYLPALEAMCSGALVICPDCVGNRELCTHDYNCLQPIYAAGAIIETIKQALTLPTSERRRLVAGGLETAKRNRPAREYRQFVAILKKAGELWKV
jgi:glycosyltransferase involved in cell wall biosynthesis